MGRLSNPFSCFLKRKRELASAANSRVAEYYFFRLERIPEIPKINPVTRDITAKTRMIKAESFPLKPSAVKV